MQCNSHPRVVLVCQNRTCRKQGAKQVLAAFQAQAVSEVTVQRSGCLGRCGSGPMVVVLPEEVWYGHVHPQEVPTVVKRHLIEQQPVEGMVYRR